jgi:hypothetical protein
MNRPLRMRNRPVYQPIYLNEDQIVKSSSFLPVAIAA